MSLGSRKLVVVALHSCSGLEVKPVLVGYCDVGEV